MIHEEYTSHIMTFAVFVSITYTSLALSLTTGHCPVSSTSTAAKVIHCIFYDILRFFTPCKHDIIFDSRFSQYLTLSLCNVQANFICGTSRPIAVWSGIQKSCPLGGPHFELSDYLTHIHIAVNIWKIHVPHIIMKVSVNLWYKIIQTINFS